MNKSGLPTKHLWPMERNMPWSGCVSHDIESSSHELGTVHIEERKKIIQNRSCICFEKFGKNRSPSWNVIENYPKQKLYLF